jgi:hypothetical protein
MLMRPAKHLKGRNTAIGRCYHFGTKLQYAGMFGVFFNNLYALAGYVKRPVFGFGGWQVFLQGF